MKQPISAALRSKRLYFDGGYGATFQSMGLPSGTSPETWNLTNPDAVRSLHKAYLKAGCDLIKTNTFGANRIKSPDFRAWIEDAMKLAREAVSEYPDAYIAFDVGPTGRLLQPFGDLPFEEAVAAFSDSIRLGATLGADCVLIETMNDAYETKAAVLAAKEVCDLPVFVTNVYDASGKLMTGADPETMTALLEGLGCDAIGMNCSLGPKQLLPFVRRMVSCASVPVIVNPNAGLPTVENGKTVFALDADEFADAMTEIAAAGASVLGGCCGTTPVYLEKAIAKTKDMPFLPVTEKNRTVITSYTHACEVGARPVLVGERINPTGKKALKAALLSGDMDYVLQEAIRQADRGAHVLDVNVGVPGIDEAKTMVDAVHALQGVTDLPLQLDSSDPKALEAAMRIYNGKPLVNSVNGKAACMEAVFPLVKRYGGVLIALTLDENGIPATAAERVAIAHRIISKAAEYGISKKDIIVDPLALTVSSDAESANITLECIRLLHAEGIHTSLGVSNISFGLPRRDLVNAFFFAQSLRAGLSMAIVNPLAEGMMNAYYAHCALAGLDAGCTDYIRYTETLPEAASQTAGTAPTAAPQTKNQALDLHTAIVRGVSSAALSLAKEKLQTAEPLSLISGDIIPALNEVGAAFENKKLYLPQLLAAADAASAVFGAVKEAMARKPEANGNGSRKPFVLATVFGDVHDIGKNIVRVLLESYGFAVTDLGKNVPAEAVLDAVKRENCKLVGLSALMTTTVPAMEETIRVLHDYDPEIRVIVGGAVLTEEYAHKIGADAYAADAMETVRYAERYYESN